MKELKRFTWLIAMLFVMGSCNNESPQFYDLYAGTTPFLEVGSTGVDPFVVFLDINQQSIVYQESSIPYEVVNESADLVQIETDFQLAPTIGVKNISYSRAEETLTLELEGLNRSLVLEKYNQMIERKVNEFVRVPLTSDISHLSDNQKKMLEKLFQVADIMDALFWEEACPEKDEILAGLTDPEAIEFFHLNYGPWEG